MVWSEVWNWCSFSQANTAWHRWKMTINLVIIRHIRCLLCFSSLPCVSHTQTFESVPIFSRTGNTLCLDTSYHYLYWGSALCFCLRLLSDIISPPVLVFSHNLLLSQTVRRRIREQPQNKLFYHRSFAVLSLLIITLAKQLGLLAYLEQTTIRLCLRSQQANSTYLHYIQFDIGASVVIL